MIDKKLLNKIFGSTLSVAGYRKKGQTWHKIGEEVIVSIDLQKSRHSNFYYVNVAFGLKALSGQDLLPTHKSDICMRAERLLPDYVDQIDTLFRLDYANLTSEEQASALRQFVSEQLIPRCDRLLDLANLRTEYESGGFRRAGVRKDVARFLEPNSENTGTQYAFPDRLID